MEQVMTTAQDDRSAASTSLQEFLEEQIRYVHENPMPVTNPIVLESDPGPRRARIEETLRRLERRQ